MLKKFDVEVVRTACAHRTLRVEAENKHKAAEKALEVAGNHKFSGHSSTYLVEFVEEVEEG